MKKILAILLTSSTICLSQTEVDLKLFDMINNHRTSNGLSPLKWDKVLYEIATNQSEYMSKTGDLSSEQKELLDSDNNLVVNLKEKFLRNGIEDDIWIGESIRVVYETSKMTTDSLSKLVFEELMNNTESKSMLMTDLYTNGAISHRTGDYNKELIGIDELGYEHYNIIECDMEWFTVDVSSNRN